MAGKSYKGTPPILRYEEAKAIADQWMAIHGYRPCLDRYQPTSSAALDAGAVVRLYTMHKSGGTKHGGVSIGLSKTELMRDGWSQYVAHQIETALQRKID